MAQHLLPHRLRREDRRRAPDRRHEEPRDPAQRVPLRLLVDEASTTGATSSGTLRQVPRPQGDAGQRLKSRGIRINLGSTRTFRSSSRSSSPRDAISATSSRTPRATCISATTGSRRSRSWISRTRRRPHWYRDKLLALPARHPSIASQTDFGERIPADAVYHDGSYLPAPLHNYYSYLYNQAVYSPCSSSGAARVTRWCSRARRRRAPSNSRCIGAATVTRRSRAWLRRMRGGLSFGLSGPERSGVTTSAVSTPTAHTGALQALGRVRIVLEPQAACTERTRYRVPWVFDRGDEARGQSAVEVARRFAKLKQSLTPVPRRPRASRRTAPGVPIMRPMQLEFPDDPAVAYLDRQYLLGPQPARGAGVQRGRRGRVLPAGRGDGRTGSRARSSRAAAGAARCTGSTRCRCGCARAPRSRSNRSNVPTSVSNETRMPRIPGRPPQVRGKAQHLGRAAPTPVARAPRVVAWQQKEPEPSRGAPTKPLETPRARCTTRGPFTRSADRRDRPEPLHRRRARRRARRARAGRGRAPGPTNRVGRPSPLVAAHPGVTAVAVNPEVDAVTISAVGLDGGIRVRERLEVDHLVTPAGSRRRRGRHHRRVAVRATARLAHRRDRAGRPRAGACRRRPRAARSAPGVGGCPDPRHSSREPPACRPSSATTRASALSPSASSAPDAGSTTSCTSTAARAASAAGSSCTALPVGGAGGYAGEFGQNRAGIATPDDRRAADGVLEDEVSRARLLAAVGLSAADEPTLAAAIAASDSPDVAASSRGGAESSRQHSPTPSTC